MKKIFLFAIAIAIGLVACDKSEVAVNNTTPIQKVSGKSYVFRDWGLNNKWNGRDCDPIADDCFDEIVVVGTSTLRYFADLVLAGNTRTALTFAERNLGDLCQYFTESDMMGFIEGVVSVSGMVNRQGKTLLFFENPDDETTFVYPFLFR